MSEKLYHVTSELNYYIQKIQYLQWIMYCQSVTISQTERLIVTLLLCNNIAYTGYRKKYSDRIIYVQHEQSISEIYRHLMSEASASYTNGNFQWNCVTISTLLWDIVTIANLQWDCVTISTLQWDCVTIPTLQWDSVTKSTPVR